VHKDMERHKARDKKCTVSGVQEARAKVSEVQEGAQVMREVGSGVGIHNEHEVT
jgi:hypothetical protein